VQQEKIVNMFDKISKQYDLVNRIVLAEAAISNLKTATANNTTAIQGNTQSISNLNLAVEQVKNDYLTKDGAFAIFADAVSVVEGVFYSDAGDLYGLNG